MQCFQKDPNLRVSAKKLLKHNWIVGCRRSDAPVAKASANFNQAVEEVKQWNKALTSSEGNLRALSGSETGGTLHNGHPSRLAGQEPSRSATSTPAKGPFTLAKPRPTAEDFRSPELAGRLTRKRLLRFKEDDSNRRADDDNWDDDFATAISPSALQLPHIKPQDHFGGLLSADRLKAFASIDSSRDISTSWDNDLDGELVTMKRVQPYQEDESQEKTIRPNWKASTKPEKNENLKPPQPSKSSPRKRSGGHHRQKSSQAKNAVPAHKFELPARPDLAYKEQSVEDYSDVFDDSESIFNQRLGLNKKVITIPSGVPIRVTNTSVLKA